MTNAVDVAKYILTKTGEITAMKLQKLIYYAQAWSLVWDENPLFEEDIQAWVNGPVIPSVYECHKGQFKVNEETLNMGDLEKLSFNQKDSIDKVLEFLGDKSNQWLSELSCIEAPWREARVGVKPLERGCQVISLASIHEYYSSL